MAKCDGQQITHKFSGRSALSRLAGGPLDFEHDQTSNTIFRPHSRVFAGGPGGID
jgi:hypothetical protein